MTDTYTLITTWSDGYRCTCCKGTWETVQQLTYEETTKINWSWWNAFNELHGEAEEFPIGIELFSMVLKENGKTLKEAYLSYPDMNVTGRGRPDRTNQSTWTVEEFFKFAPGGGMPHHTRTIYNYVENTPDKLYRWALSSGGGRVE